MRKIIITGASGMIGANLVQVALANGCEVLCIVRKNSLKVDNIPSDPRVKIVFFDANEYAHVILDERYDTFFHLAWDKTFGQGRDDLDSQIRNIQYTLDAVRLASRSGCTHFVGAGSQAEYGPVLEPINDRTITNPETGYGIAKYTAGKMASVLARQFNLHFNWVRVLSVYGSLDNPHTLIMYVLNELNHGRSPELTKCEQIWDYLFESDAAEAFYSIGERGKDGQFYVLGYGKGRRLKEYLEIINEKMKSKLNIVYGAKPYYVSQPMYLVADIDDLHKDTGWSPLYSFEDGIECVIKSIQKGENE